MYAPGFITGRLINRFGAELIGTAGLAITLLAILTGFLGQEVMHYWLLLILLGIGWNLGVYRCLGQPAQLSSPGGADAGAVAE